MKKKNIEAIYPLSPTQAGMLFHTIYDRESSVYFEQFRCSYHGNLELDALKRAWEHVVSRHAVLRTLFMWEKRKEPFQVVRQTVTLPWEVHDWRGTPEAEAEARFEALLEADRKQGFALEQAPLMRITLVRLADAAYRFVWSYHHLLFDGWSRTTLFAEALAVYEAYCRDEAPRLPAPVPYRGYIAWLKEQDAQQAASFWQETLAGFQEPTGLTGERADDAGDMLFGSQALTMDRAATESLQQLIRKASITLNTLVHGAWALVLSRYSGKNDVLFGSTVSGRPAQLPRVSDMVGLFINTLPVRIRIHPDMALTPWLQACQKHLLSREQYGYASLVDIQGWSEIPRGVPMFENIINFENYPVDHSLQKQGDFITIDGVGIFEQTNYPLAIEVVPGDRLSLVMNYNGHLFSQAAVRRMLDHMHALLAAMAAHPDCLLQDLPVMGAQERALLLHQWNATDTPVPADRCFSELFEDQAARVPEHIAASFQDRTICYAELNGKANLLAEHLIAQGIGPESRVLLFMPRSIDFLTAVLGTFKAGGAYIPLDIFLPEERTRYMIALSGARLLLCNAELLPTVETALAAMPDAARPAVRLLSDMLQGAGRPNLPCRATPDNLAYIIYTSGSTGAPKGAMLRQAGMVNHLYAKIKDMAFQEMDILVQNASQCFDISVWQFLTPLAVGGRVHIVDDEVARDPKLLMADTLAQGAHVLEVVPSMLRIMLEEIARGEEPLAFPNLRLLVLTGEALPPDLCNAWLARYPHIPIVNAYGPTECSDDVTHYTITEAGVHHTNVPIGKALINTRLYVLDKQLAPVPVGGVGELYVGGMGVGRGYLDDPGRTAQVFLPDCFTVDRGARLYRTGDLVRYDDTGALAFLGRIDHQVKIRGHRIEIGEVEVALRGYPGLGDVVVTAREDRPGDKRLVAYVVAEREEVGSGELRDYLLSKLPDYMIPGAFVYLDAMPLTPNGKIDRQALPAPEGTVSGKGHVDARSPTEHTLMEVWAEALELPKVGIYDNFFELGGHSLIATRVIARIRSMLQVELPLRDLFARPVLADLAMKVDELRLGKPIHRKPLLPVDRSGLLPVSYAQQRLWFLDQLEPDSSAYNVTRPLRIHGQLDVPALEKAFQALVARHEILRTVYPCVDGKAFQRVNHDLVFCIEHHDLGFLPEAEREQEATRRGNEASATAFNLQEGPLFRVQLLRLAADDHVVIVSVHHILSDGWSRGILVGDTVEFYRAFTEGRAPNLEELPIQYGDYAAWQRSREAEIGAQMTWWRAHLEGVPTLDLPTDRPHPPVFQYNGGSLSVRLEPAFMDALQELCVRLSVTPFMLTLAALEVLLYRHSGQSDIAVGSPIANRAQKETEGLIGFFVNTLVLRTKLDGNPTFQELLGRIREITLGAYDNQELPFEHIVEALNPARDLSRNPLFQVAFSFETVPYHPVELPGIETSYLDAKKETVIFDQDWTLTNDQQGLEILLDYNADIYDHDSIERIVDQYRFLLESVLENPRQPIDTMPLFRPEQVARVVDGWNQTDRAFGGGAHVLDLIAARAARTPDAVALVGEHTELSYRALMAQVDRVASDLVAHGVLPGHMVGLCMLRAPEMVTALLAILRAGAAYVPLDPNYPGERLAYMVENAGIRLLLTQEALSPEPVFQSLTRLCMDVHQPGTDPAPLPDISADMPAYVIYTSGSTGVPKGVVIPHGALLHFTHAAIDTYGLTAEDRVLQFASISFDTAVEEIFPTLAIGARLVLRTDEMLRTVPAFLEAIAARHITVLDLPTAFWHQMVAELAAQKLTLPDCLKVVIIGGERALPEQVTRWLAHVDPAVHLFNTYGPTEATVVASAQLLTGDTVEAGREVPIGRPLPNTRIYLLDRHGMPVPEGVPGELYIGGAGLAAGYLHDETLTAAKFVANPLPGRAHERLFKTGDLARYRPDGRLEFVGRADNQIKIRGFRVEPGEIETALLKLDGLREAMVVAREDRPGEKRLVAYLVDEDAAATREQELRLQLEATLPNYMIPAAFVFLDELPLTANGKLDLAALPEPGARREALDYVAPRSHEEKEVARIWSEVLGVGAVGIFEDFFAIGGHSLLATQVISRVQESLQVALPLLELFKAPTVAGLAEAVVRVRHTAAAPDMGRIARRSRKKATLVDGALQTSLGDG